MSLQGEVVEKSHFSPREGTQNSLKNLCLKPKCFMKYSKVISAI